MQGIRNEGEKASYGKIERGMRRIGKERASWGTARKGERYKGREGGKIRKSEMEWEGMRGR